MQCMLPFYCVHACQDVLCQMPFAVQQFRFMHGTPSMEWLSVSWRGKQALAAMFRHVSYVRDSVLMQLSSLVATLHWLACFHMCCWLDLALCLQGVVWVGGIGSSDLEKVVEQMRSNSEAIQLCTFYYISDAYEVCTLGRAVGVVDALARVNIGLNSGGFSPCLRSSVHHKLASFCNMNAKKWVFDGDATIGR